MAATIAYLDDGKIEISTKRLLLRGGRENDSAGLYEAFRDAEVMRYWCVLILRFQSKAQLSWHRSTLPHSSQDQTKEWVHKMIQSPQNGVVDFIICLQPDFTPIGKIGVWQDQEVGFMLARAYWGQGLAQEALRAVIPYFFQEVGMSEITADTDPRNAASIGLLQKLGFVVFDFKEKTWQIGAEWFDSTYLKLTKEKWEAQGGAP